MPQETSPREAPWVSSQAVGRSSKHSTEVAGVSAGVNSRGVVQSCADIVQQKLTIAMRAVVTRSSCLSIMRVLAFQIRSATFFFCSICLFIRRTAYNTLPQVRLASVGPYNAYLSRLLFTRFCVLYSSLGFITPTISVPRRFETGLPFPASLLPLSAAHDWLLPHHLAHPNQKGPPLRAALSGFRCGMKISP